jgi:hypothetical protein
MMNIIIVLLVAALLIVLALVFIPPGWLILGALVLAIFGGLYLYAK